MAVLRKIQCDVTGCNSSFTEEYENQGFPGWGHVKGLMEETPNGLRDMAYLCPECLEKTAAVLNRGFDNDLG